MKDLGLETDAKGETAVGQWRFNKQVASIFEDHVRKNTPFYDEMHRMIAEMSDWYLSDSNVVYDLGTSTGECIRRIYERHSNKRLRFVAVDGSKDMIEKAKIRLLHVPNVQYLVSDLNEPFAMHDANLILIALTLQFLRADSRPRLLKETYNGLLEGGALVLVEKILGKNAGFDEMYVELHHDMKRRSGVTDQEIVAKEQSLRGVMRPYPLGRNLALLREAGFKEIDVFFKWYNWAGILALK